MFRERLVFLIILAAAAPAPSVAADAPLPLAPPGHGHARHGGHVPDGASLGIAYGLVPGLGQLGAAAYGYYGAVNCWSRAPAYDNSGEYIGELPVNICLN